MEVRGKGEAGERGRQGEGRGRGKGEAGGRGRQGEGIFKIFKTL